MLRHSLKLVFSSRSAFLKSANICSHFRKSRKQLVGLPVQTTHLDFLQVPAVAFSLFRKMGDTQSGLPDTTRVERDNKVVLSDEEWRAKLTSEQYHVCRQHGTERAWTGELLDSKGKGIYQCACCGADLFNSSTKFDSGSGWPSFFDALKDKDNEALASVDTISDRSHGMVRTEVRCGKCDSHLGHVFNDGPNPTGLRYCINSVSLKFKRDRDGKNSKSEL